MAMAMDTGYLADLEKAIRLRYRCTTTHRQSVFVHEKTPDNETIWIGDVEVFDLTGCKDASRCFAWEDIEDDLRIVIILQSRFVDSAQRAVQAAIYSGVQSPKAPAGEDASHSRQRLDETKN